MQKRSTLEKHRSLFDRVIELRSEIRPETGRRFDAMAAPDAAADRLLQMANNRESEKVANWRATVERDIHRLKEAQSALKHLKQQVNLTTGISLEQIKNAIRVKQSQAASLKAKLSIEKNELRAIDKGKAPWLIEARSTASSEADCVRKWHSHRLRFITRELEQEYVALGGLANIKKRQRLDLAELVLLITAVIVDPDAEEWSPRLSNWQDLPWEVRIAGERMDNRLWTYGMDIHTTRRQIGEQLLGRDSDRWLHIAGEAVKIITISLADPDRPKGKTSSAAHNPPSQKRNISKQPLDGKPRKKGRKVLYGPQLTVDVIQAYVNWKQQNPGLKQSHFTHPLAPGVNGIKNAWTRLRGYRCSYKKSKLTDEVFEEKNNLPKGLMRQMLDL